MKIWSETLTADDLREAAGEVINDFPGTLIEVFGAETLVDRRTRRWERVGIRSLRPHPYRRNPGTSRGRENQYDVAASWTEWGWWLARLFERDPNMRANGYRVDSFHRQTWELFRDPRSPRERQVAAIVALGRRTPSPHWVGPAVHQRTGERA